MNPLRRASGWATPGLIGLKLPAAQGQVAPAAKEAARCGGLHRAAWRSDVDALERLLATRPDLEARDAHGRTPQQLARERGYGAMVRMLEAARALRHVPGMPTGRNCRAGALLDRCLT